jgi:hypothetical protein
MKCKGKTRGFSSLITPAPGVPSYQEFRADTVQVTITIPRLMAQQVQIAATEWDVTLSHAYTGLIAAGQTKLMDEGL